MELDFHSLSRCISLRFVIIHTSRRCQQVLSLSLSLTKVWIVHWHTVGKWLIFELMQRNVCICQNKFDFPLPLCVRVSDISSIWSDYKRNYQYNITNIIRYNPISRGFEVTFSIDPRHEPQQHIKNKTTKNSAHVQFKEQRTHVNYVRNMHRTHTVK